MIVDGFWPVFGYGCLGGFLAEFLKLYKFRENFSAITYLRSVLYWIVTFGMVIIGGFVATFYGVEMVSAPLAVNIGASAPLILSAFANTVPAVAKSRKAPAQIRASLSFAELKPVPAGFWEIVRGG